MGTDCHAYAVIGCEVTGKLYEQREVRQCGCPPSDGKFCPNCGRPNALKVEQVPKPFYDPDFGKLTLTDGGTLVVRTTTDAERAFVGISTNGADQYDCATPITFEPGSFGAAYDVIKAGLEPLGLWDPDKFGVWVVFHCSY